MNPIAFCCRKKIEKLRAGLQLLDSQDRTPNKHTFFVDTDREVKNFDLAKQLDTHPSLLGRTSNRLKVNQKCMPVACLHGPNSSIFIF